MNALDVFKQVVKNYMTNAKLSNLVYGTVSSVSLTGASVKLDHMSLPLPEAFVSVPKHLLQHDEVVYNDDGIESTVHYRASLMPGSRVIMLSQQGGQKYAVIGKLK